MTAAQHALAEGDAGLAAQRLVYARDAEPNNPVVLRLLTTAFWQAGNLQRGRAHGARLGARRDRSPDARALRRAHLRGHGRDRPGRRGRASAPPRARPSDASEWERLGRLRLRLMDRAGAISALERRATVGPSVEGLLGLALAYHLAGDVGAEVSTAEAATMLEPDSAAAWTSFAHALARTDRVSECIDACRTALRARRRGRGGRPARARRGGAAARAGRALSGLISVAAAGGLGRSGGRASAAAGAAAKT